MADMAIATKTKATGHVTPRPFLKWVGGKGLLLPELMKRVEMAGNFGRYHEPMLGGGALFFALYRAWMLKRQAWLSDVNPRLMETWGAVRNDSGLVISTLRDRQCLHNKEYYYTVRDNVEPMSPWTASRFIYLNKTCFNGLYRENLSGRFNVPIGKYKNPTICDAENLRAVSKALRSKAKLFCGHFSDVLDRAKPGDLVYLDPPYMPVKLGKSFTTYHAGGFGLGQHELLAYTFDLLDTKGVKVLLSNSDTPMVRDLYAGFTIEEVQGNRSVSCKGSGRGRVNDVLVRNF